MIMHKILDIISKNTMLNIFYLLLLFSIGVSGIFSFEIEILNSLSFRVILIIIPLLLFFNTFLFQSKWQKVLNGLIFLPYFIICSFLIYPFSINLSPTFICRYTQPEGYIVSVYASPSISFRNSGYCITRKRQIRIIPGILVNQGLLDSSECPGFHRRLEPRMECPKFKIK